MTYTVKNGTWCKDNEKEYYSTTKTGLKAALKAGEITAGTKVVIHEPKYHAGQLIQSLNPNCPEGCFVPDGSAFDTSVYTELAAVFPDGNLPDMRECVLVMAGQNEHLAIYEHDVFSAGEFKDDQAQLVEHDHAITDPGHDHAITDPGHDHEITDPGHDHGRGTQEITGTFGSDDFNIPENPVTGAFYKQRGLEYDAESDPTGAGFVIALQASRTWTGRSENVTTGVSVNNNTTGITVGSGTTGITVNTKGNNNVTRTKQFGVYYYIAF